MPSPDVVIAQERERRAHGRSVAGRPKTQPARKKKKKKGSGLNVGLQFLHNLLRDM